MEEKYKAVFILHALGDTIGFKNGDWEFNYEKINSSIEAVFEFIYEFIELGGVNGINLKNWHVSDDTLYHMAIAEALLEYDDKSYDENYDKYIDKYIWTIKKHLIKTHKRIFNDTKQHKIMRYQGLLTDLEIQKFTKKNDARHSKYNYKAYGNGCAMKSLCIGLAFHNKKDLNKLLDISITSSMLTHNSPLGYLAGLTIAYFTYLAINKYDIETWIYKLLELLESKLIKQHIDLYKNDTNFIDISDDYIKTIKIWKEYLNVRFNNNNKPIKEKIFTNFQYRLQFYHSIMTKTLNDTLDFNRISAWGCFTALIAYDALIDCDGKWEKLIFYAMLHTGDSDTIGAVAGGLYGAVYGFGDVPKSMLEHLEEKENLYDLAAKIYKKFN